MRGRRNAIRRVSVLGSGAEVGHRVTGGLGDVPGLSRIDAPAAADPDGRATVLAVELDGELDLHRGRGRS